jgi:hypothetical protein
MGPVVAQTSHTESVKKNGNTNTERYWTPNQIVVFFMEFIPVELIFAVYLCQSSRPVK